jgi:hypothetical protein
VRPVINKILPSTYLEDNKGLESGWKNGQG